jgi:phosphotransferase system enzyme I (PtsI)
MLAPEEEAELFRSAVKLVAEDLEQIKGNVEVDAGADTAGIFEAQLLMLRDPIFADDVERKIRTQQLTAMEAIRQSAASVRGKFSSLSNEYIRERAEDMTDIESRLIAALRGKHEDLDYLKKRAKRNSYQTILVSQRLAAATIAHLGKKLLAGIVTETGTRTSHLAIVARSLGIPAVLGVENIVKGLTDGELLLIDGARGQVIVNPNDEEEREARKRTKRVSNAKTFGWEPTKTLEGHSVQVFANVGDLQSVEEASKSGAEGIGLFRTEFLYFGRESLPDEDELYNVIRKSIELMQGRRLVIRTLDIGGDKKPSYIDFPEERNPLLGLRGIRFSLKNPSMLKCQLSAILRASTEGDIWVMFPMISTINELIEAKQITDQVKVKLKEKNLAFGPRVKIGAMIETPSAALTADTLAREADFFSIGTNDLVQYALVADRENEHVSSIADPLEPSVLKLIRHTAEAAHSKKRHVGICGEMAADPEAIPILIGLGLDELSVNPSSIVTVKKLIQSIKFSKSKKAASKALSMNDALEIRSYIRTTFQAELEVGREAT